MNGWICGKNFPNYGDNSGNFWRSPTGQICPNVPRYTESIDAALTLVPKGASWDIGSYADAYYANVRVKELVETVANTPAIALMIACLKAQQDSGLGLACRVTSDAAVAASWKRRWPSQPADRTKAPSGA